MSAKTIDVPAACVSSAATSLDGAGTSDRAGDGSAVSAADWPLAAEERQIGEARRSVSVECDRLGHKRRRTLWAQCFRPRARAATSRTSCSKGAAWRVRSPVKTWRAAITAGRSCPCARATSVSGARHAGGRWCSFGLRVKTTTSTEGSGTPHRSSVRDAGSHGSCWRKRGCGIDG